MKVAKVTLAFAVPDNTPDDELRTMLGAYLDSSEFEPGVPYILDLYPRSAEIVQIEITEPKEEDLDAWSEWPNKAAPLVAKYLKEHSPTK